MKHESIRIVALITTWIVIATLMDIIVKPIMGNVYWPVLFIVALLLGWFWNDVWGFFSKHKN